MDGDEIVGAFVLATPQRRASKYLCYFVLANLDRAACLAIFLRRDLESVAARAFPPFRPSSTAALFLPSCAVSDSLISPVAIFMTVTLDPARLFFRDYSDLFCDLGQVLILAEHNGHIVAFLVRQSDQINRQAYVNALFFANTLSDDRAVADCDLSIAVSELSAECPYALPSDGEQLTRPKLIPPNIVSGIREACVEPDLSQCISAALAHGLRKSENVIIRM